uniref:Endonuclease I n=1 Tax=Sphingobacterium sp. (strain 21) TaxID=743722 RepID=F4CEV9_SPHS2
MKMLSLFLDQIQRVRDRQKDKKISSVEKSSEIKNRPLTAVNPLDLSNYLKQHDLSVEQFINDPNFQERIIGRNDLLNVHYLRKGAKAAQSVCRIHITSDVGPAGFGTGFLIAPQILLTNHHVLPTTEWARYSSAEFNYEENETGAVLRTSQYRFDADKLFYTNEVLDFTIVWVDHNDRQGVALLQQFGFLPLRSDLGKIKEGDYVSIIQHADGSPKQVVLRENSVTDLSLTQFVRYVADTKSGSSGAPVFNDDWEVVALHHAGVPRYNTAGQILNLAGTVWDSAEGEMQINWQENEGVRVSSIIHDIRSHAIKQFSFLAEFFAPLSDLSIIEKESGTQPVELTDELYYPQADDEEDKKRYYREVGDVGKADYNRLQRLLESSHTNPLSYQPSKYVYPKVDIYPDGLLRSIYSGKSFTIEELQLADQRIDIERKLRFIEWSKKAGTMNREDYRSELKTIEKALPYNCEHVVCQSWFDAREPMRGDLHHLFACEPRCNSFRNNHPYYDFEGYKPIPSQMEKEMATCGYMEDDQFEPENNKGIVARATLYFLLRYPNAISVYKDDDIVLLKRWAKEQAVTLYEKHRNREIFLLQGNRNPFIDFPELIDSIDFQVSEKILAAVPHTAREVKSRNLAADVKRAVLMRYGYANPDPSVVEDTKAMTDFEFSDNQYLMLTASFNDIAVRYRAKPLKITVSEVQACGSIKDCIDLVYAAIA